MRIPRHPYLLPAAGAVWFMVAGAAVAAPDQPPAYINDFGWGGLLQMPSARMFPDGQLSFTTSYVDPYIRYALTFQALPWLEGTFRYTDILNRPYGPAFFSGNQSYKDRGIDLKIRLSQETRWWPALAVGVRDFGGTGLFGAEYVVTSKRFGNFDISIGMGWGNLATRRSFGNPLSSLSSRLKTRQVNDQPGAVTTVPFSGPDVGLFGGFSYDLPVKGLTAKFEYDSNNYRKEALGNKFPVDLPLNAGLEYRPLSWLVLAAGIERGNQYMVRLSLTGNMHEKSGLPKFDAPPPLPAPRSAGREQASGEPENRDLVPGQQVALTVVSSAERAAAQGLRVDSRAMRGRELAVTLSGEPLRDAVTAAQSVAEAAAVEYPEAERIRIDLVMPGAAGMTISFEGRLLRGQIPAAPAAAPPAVTADTAGKAVAAKLKEQGIFLISAELKPPIAHLHVAQGRYLVTTKALGRTLRSAAAALPPGYETLIVTLHEGAVATVTMSVPRRSLERALLEGTGSQEEVWAAAGLSVPLLTRDQSNFYSEETFPRVAWGVEPRFRQTIGRPEAFFLYQLYGAALAEVEWFHGFITSGAVGVNIYNTYNRMREGSDSVLPHVRSDLKKYQQSSQTFISHLQANYMFNLTPVLSGQVYGGLLEEMFAGAGAELVWRPRDSNWSYGIDASWVKQREYHQKFRFLDYQTVVARLAARYHFDGPNLDVTLSGGRYLAKDVGATIDIGRTFDSGIVIGAFATKTNVSAARFGEGSFDKGFYVILPLDQIFVKSSRGAASWLYRPLQRDGGQMLYLRRRIFDATEASAIYRVRRSADELLQ